MRAQRVLIAGCGDLGTRAARALPDAQVYGLRRNTALLPRNIRPVSADLLTGEGFAALPEQVDTLIYAPTPGARAECGYQAIYVDALQRLLNALPNPQRALRLIFVSSSAVYGQNAAEWVDERSVAESTSFNGQRLRDGEAMAKACVDDSVCLRLSGLYGPDRPWLLNRVQAGKPIAAGIHYSNRIHIEDAASLLSRLAVLEAAPACVIGVDNEPAALGEVLDWIADALNLPRLPRTGDAAEISGKRLRNDLSHAIGWRPRYACYRDGYTDVLTTKIRTVCSHESVV